MEEVLLRLNNGKNEKASDAQRCSFIPVGQVDSTGAIALKGGERPGSIDDGF